MKLFSLKEYYKNPTRKVVTRDGRKAKIICTDVEDDRFPIVALVLNEDGSAHSFGYTKYGLWSDNGESSLDLFFEPIKKEGWINVYKGVIENHLPYVGQKVYKSKEEAIRNKCSDYYFTTLKIEWEE